MAAGVRVLTVRHIDVEDGHRRVRGLNVTHVHRAVVGDRAHDVVGTRDLIPRHGGDGERVVRVGQQSRDRHAERRPLPVVREKGVVHHFAGKSIPFAVSQRNAVAPDIVVTLVRGGRRRRE